MKLTVEYVYDDEVQAWGFVVPSLRLVGGMDPTREAAEAHCLEAIAFALEDDEIADEGGERVSYDVDLRPAS